jgi:hypothetical protein
MGKSYMLMGQKAQNKCANKPVDEKGSDLHEPDALKGLYKGGQMAVRKDPRVMQEGGKCDKGWNAQQYNYKLHDILQEV